MLFFSSESAGFSFCSTGADSASSPFGTPDSVTGDSGSEDLGASSLDSEDSSVDGVELASYDVIQVSSSISEER